MTMPKLLFDTSALIPAIAGLDPWAGLLKRAISQDQLLLSCVVVAEYLVKSTKNDEVVLNNLCDSFPPLPIDLATARLAAEIRRESLGRKQKFHLPDCMIAAQCQLSGVELVTANPKDFPKEIVRLI